MFDWVNFFCLTLLGLNSLKSKLAYLGSFARGLLITTMRSWPQFGTWSVGTPVSLGCHRKEINSGFWFVSSGKHCIPRSCAPIPCVDNRTWERECRFTLLAWRSDNIPKLGWRNNFAEIWEAQDLR